MSSSPTIEYGPVDIMPGYTLGMAQPSLAAQIRLGAVADDTESIRHFFRLLEPHLPPEHLAEIDAAKAGGRIGFAKAIGAAVAGLQESAGIPVLGSVQVKELSLCVDEKSEKQADLFQVVFPSLEPRAAKLVLEWLLQVLNKLDPEQQELSVKQQKTLGQLLQRLRSVAPGGTNNIRFIKAAHALGIPILSLPGGVFQYGWGARGRWFNSSITDETPSIGVGHAKNKLLTAATLSIGGLPVPVGRRVKSMTDAVSLARKVGYPVVVKPADRDQGAGVHADLRNDNEVYAAFKQASKLSANIMLERHLEGTAFRITLFRGEPLAIVQRLPAGVTGDGASTVEALIEQTNADPRRSSSRFSIMKPIVIDDEARFLLKRAGLSLNSIPPVGQFIALRKAANVSTGGDAIVLDTHEVDPSYLSLVKRAAALLRLDIAAVDFITQDIRRPWHEADAAIIEVNAQPQMGTILTHLHRHLLSSYVHGDGSVPSMLVMGADREELIRQVRESTMHKLAGLGSVAADGVFIGKDRVGDGGKEPLSEARILLIDPSVTALLLAGELNTIANQGLPLQFIHNIVLSDWPDEWGKEPQALDLLRYHLHGKVWFVKNHPLQAHAERLFGHDRTRMFESRNSMLDAIGLVLNEESHE